jgi:iron complex transport system substrate-binding protein
MRIVSLLPAATEWVCALGAADALVGRSHECDHPPEIRDRPVLTAPSFDAEADSAAIDDAVEAQVQDGLSLYDVDLDRLRALDPDLIVTQDQCDVCAVSRSGLEEHLAEWTGTAPSVFSLQPSTLKDLFDEVLRLGRKLGRLERAMEVLADGETRLKALRNRIGVDRRTDPETLPSVVCIEWLEPLMVAGHWMPDVVDMAGGRPVLAEAGTPTRRVEWGTVREADPDVIACMPCGFTVEETRRDLSYLTERKGWEDLTAVRRGRVALLDGSAYYNRPGARIYRAIALLASVIYPDLSLESPPAPWEKEGPNPFLAAPRTPWQPSSGSSSFGA